LRLAKLSLLEELPTVHIPSAKVRKKRSFIAYREQLVQRQTKIKNSIRALLDRQGLRMPVSKSGWTQAICQELREMARPLDEAGEMDLCRCQSTLCSFFEQEATNKSIAPKQRKSTRDCFAVIFKLP